MLVRQHLAKSCDDDHQLITRSHDFYSKSTFRDLIFHTQEHHFSLPQIKKCLREVGLEFSGFEGTDLISDFREIYGQQTDIRDLSLWNEYERRNPQAFIGMYQFWCEKL